MVRVCAGCFVGVTESLWLRAEMLGVRQVLRNVDAEQVDRWQMILDETRAG